MLRLMRQTVVVHDINWLISHNIPPLHHGVHLQIQLLFLSDIIANSE